MTVRAHFLTAVFVALKHYKLLLVPVIRVVLKYVFGFGGAFLGAGLDAVIITLLILYCIGKWRCAAITADGGSIHFTSGIFAKSSVSVERDCIFSIGFRQGLITCLFDCGTLGIYTENPIHPAIKLCVKRTEAAKLFPDIILRSADKKSDIKQSTALALFTANSRSGLVFFAAALSLTAKGIGADLRETVISGYTDAVLSGNISKLLILLSLAVTIGISASFFINALRYAMHDRKEQGGKVVLQSGIIDKMRFVAYRTPYAAVVSGSVFLMRSGLSTVYEAYHGFGSDSYGHFPSDIVFAEKSKRRGEIPKSVMSFLTLPVTLSLSAFSAAVFFVCLGYAAPLVPIVVLFAAAWYIFCGVLNFRCTFVCENTDTLTVGFARHSHIYTAELEKCALCMAVIKQNPFGRISGRANVRFYVPGHRSPSIKAKHISAEFCRKVCEST